MKNVVALLALLFSVPMWGQQTLTPQTIQGADHPEAILDNVAYHLVFLVLSNPSATVPNVTVI